MCLHETGVITVRQRKQCDSALGKRRVSFESLSMLSIDWKSGDRIYSETHISENRKSSDVTYPLNEIRHDHDVQYELICSSEAYRMIHRNSKIVAFAISPVAECRAAVVLMDGRTLFYQLRDKAIDSGTVRGSLSSFSKFLLHHSVTFSFTI